MPEKQPRQPPKDKKQRLARALKANLARRKAQAKARKAQVRPPSD
jgi:hypothetical protein